MLKMESDCCPSAIAQPCGGGRLWDDDAGSFAAEIARGRGSSYLFPSAAPKYADILPYAFSRADSLAHFPAIRCCDSHAFAFSFSCHMLFKTLLTTPVRRIFRTTSHVFAVPFSCHTLFRRF